MTSEFEIANPQPLPRPPTNRDAPDQRLFQVEVAIWPARRTRRLPWNPLDPKTDPSEQPGRPSGQWKPASTQTTMADQPHAKLGKNLNDHEPYR